MKFRSDFVTNILNNQGNAVENIVRSIHHSKRIVIAQGYGAATQVPRRFLAYAIPVLRLASQLSEKTTIEFYFATHGVKRANGKFYQDSLSKMIDELAWLVQSYYPKIASRVRILEDAPLTVEVERVVNALLPSAQLVTERQPQIAQFVKNKGGEGALRYMLEHLIYMRDPFLVNGQPNSELLVPGMATTYDHVIMIGGPAEKVFWHFRLAMLAECGLHNGWKSHQLFTPIGDPPTYHVHPGEPVVDGSRLDYNLLTHLKNLPSEFSKQKNLIRDYSILWQEFAGTQTFKLPHEVEPVVLEKGEKIFHSRYSAPLSQNNKS